MTIAVSALLVLAWSVFPASGSKGDEKAQGAAVSGPRLEITPESYDFGKATQNQKLVKEFQIENRGTKELIIGRISTSCGCTVAEPSAKVLKPGEKTSLKVTLETRRYKGALQRSVSISSNDPKRVKTIKVKVLVEEASS